MINYAPATGIPSLYVYEENVHGLNTHNEVGNVHAEFALRAHQIFFRITGGDALFKQRCKAFISDSDQNRGNENPLTLGGEDNIAMSPIWWTFGPQYSAPVFYYFVGEHLNESRQWTADFANDHSWDRYSNGYLTTLFFDDIGGDKDFNDLVLEIAMMWLPITPMPVVKRLANQQAKIDKRFFAERVPAIKAYREEVLATAERKARRKGITVKRNKGIKVKQVKRKRR